MYGFGTTLYQTNRIRFTRPPGNIEQPTIIGDPIVGEKVGCNPGLWENNTSQFQYQWMIDGEHIIEQTGNTYTISINDLGKPLSCEVTASNVYGITIVESRSVTVILPR
jgi:hypothetical protein